MEINSAGCKTICVPAPSEADYEKLIKNPNSFRAFLDPIIEKSPELFPEINNDVYQIRPDSVLPYMVGLTDDVEKALYLRRFGIPLEALAYVFGRNPSYWYRLYQAIGRFSIVGTTIKAPEAIPLNLTSDEKHSKRKGNKIFIPTTVSCGCFLGVDIVPTAKTTDLVKGYGTFRQEAQNLKPDYQPETVNTDGWDQTQLAWQQLFPGVAIILCFLHSILDIQKRCRKDKVLWKKVTGRLWHIYKAPSKRHFGQRLRRVREWAKQNIKTSKTIFNRLISLMNYQDRLLFNMQRFHGSEEAARRYLRAMALIWNFHPYGRRTITSSPDRHTPFKDLNGFEYHDNWLRNLLIAGSMNGYRQ